MEINTKAIIEKWQQELINRISNLNVEPVLNIIQIGNDEASNKYVANKVKISEKLGVNVNLLKFSSLKQDDLENLLAIQDKPTILQLPVQDINVDEAMKWLKGSIDVDGFTIMQKGKLVNGDVNTLVPATALGVHRILKETVGDLTGKKVVIVNRSHLIGQPLLQLMLKENAYVSMLHSKTPTKRLREELKSADIVITGCGKRAIFGKEYFKNGQVLIDCSMYHEEGIPGVGDMDKEDILNNLDVKIASGYGHTGPSTVMGLMENVIRSYEIK